MSNVQEILNIIDKIGAEHPYKISGMPETYDKYNEAWCDACDKIARTIESCLKKKEVKYYIVYDFEGKNAEIGTGHITITFLDDYSDLTDDVIIKMRKFIT